MIAIHTPSLDTLAISLCICLMILTTIYTLIVDNTSYLFLFGILIGLGAFHRAHQAVYQEHLLVKNGPT